MKTLTLTLVFSSLAIFAATLLAQSHSKERWTRQKAESWFARKEWLGGLKLKPHASVNKVEFANQYHLEQSRWDSAFAFLKRENLELLAKGRHPIVGDDVFASITEDSTKDFEKTSWESHRKYADIQYVIRGEEKIGVCPIGKATVTQEYLEKNDVAHYSAKGTLYRARPGVFFIFFSSDAHRPNITPGGNRADKKIVIKVRLNAENAQ